MMSRQDEYARRRGLLQLRCTAQRQRLEYSMAQITADLRRFERGIAAVRKFTLGLVGRAWVLFNSLQRIKRSILPTE
jgi:hypothetical protein